MPDDALQLELERLPVAALATRDDVLVAVNRAFEESTGWRAADVLGRTLPELLSRLVAPRDLAVLERLVKNREQPEPQRRGSLWCCVLTAQGEERPVRVEWRLMDDDRGSVTVLVDAQPEAFGQEVTAQLARVAGSLTRCASEDEVLQRAVDALCEQGLTATVLLMDEGEPLLRYGPSRTPGAAAGRVELPRPPREILAQINPAFYERRAAYFQDGTRLVREVYAEPVAERLLALLPAQRMVQAPLFLGEAPYGALVVTGDALTPLVATALDLFAELVGKAVEAVRLRQERVERERLAALGEAAAVMAHEVRNPVGAIMNALALLDRQPAEGEGKALLSIISEEAGRLAQLVDQLLELGRPLHPRPSITAMESVIDGAVRLLTKRGQVRDRTLRMPTSRGTAAWLDPALAELALANVIVNALQSTAAGGEVRLAVEETGDAVRCLVDDDGPGIPDDVRARLGQPFVTTRATGTGMGLAVVRRIMEASGGRVLAETREGGGTRLALEFPTPPSAPRG